MSVLSNSNAISSGGATYTMSDSLRFRSSASAYLQKTLSASRTDARKQTISVWVKRGKIGALQSIIGGYDGGSANRSLISFQTTNYLEFYTGYSSNILYTSNIFRDPSSWYHIVYTLDSTQATSTNRVKLYINGVQQTLNGTYPPLNYNFQFVYPNANNYIGTLVPANRQFDGYMTEFNFVDGQALTASDFGEYGEETGAWQAKKYTGTYGTNGFYLNMSTSGSTITDQSGNGNNWTANNMNLTTSTTTSYDKMKDVPTPTDESTGNFCTMNPLTNFNGNSSISQGNLYFTGSTNQRFVGTMAVSSGKWYFEFQIVAVAGAPQVGIARDFWGYGVSGPGNDANSWGVWTQNGTPVNGGSSASTLGGFTTGDKLQVALDMDSGKVWFGKNNTWSGGGNPSAGTGATFSNVTGVITPAYQQYATNAFNFGQRPFAYTPPTGFKAWTTSNIPDSAVLDGSQHFFPKLFTGTGSTLTVTGLEFSPDWVWFKQRGKADYHQAYDTLRGVARNLSINQTVAQQNSGTAGLTAFNSDGFTIGTWNNLNQSGIATVAWCWRASDSAPVSNTDGTRTSTVSTNTDAGFSIVNFNSGSSSFTVGHGLGTTPAMLIMKDYTSTTNWAIWHKGLSNLAQNWLQFDTNGENGNSTAFNNTAPSASVVSLSNSYLFNSNQDCIMYAFAEVEGFSKFGTYVANSSTDGPFVYTGFRPAFVMVKARNMGQEWVITDSERGSYNPNDKALFPNNSNSESTSNAVDYLSNGFKIRTSGDGTNYNSGQTYIYVAFAENPFKNSLAR